MKDDYIADYSILFKYEFESGLGPWEDARYVREIKMNILARDEFSDDEKDQLIGKVLFKIIYIDQAINDGYDLMEVFDHCEYTFRHGQDFFDFDTNEIKENIQKFYDYEFEGSNICILENIEIIPEFRGNRIAAKATKDIIFHFGAGCSLFVLQPYPLQFDRTINEQDDWDKKLKLGDFPSDKEVAFKQLRKYYKSFGFDQIRGYKNLFFYNPVKRNKIMDAIDLEE